jgi:hypothetical protein
MPTLLLNPYNQGQLPALFQLGLIQWHNGAQMALPKTVAVRSLFFEKSAEQYTEEHAGFSESGFSHVTTDGEDYAFTSDTEGDHITLTQVKRTVRRKITEDLIEFNRYPKIASLLRKTGTKLWRGYALDLSHRFTFAFDTSMTDRDGRVVTMTGGDGAALCADTHTLNNGDTYDNKLVARLSESALEDAEDLGAAMVDQNGEQVNPSFTTLVTANHAATRHMAERLTGQAKQVGTDLNDMNPYSGKLRHVVVPYLDSTASGAKNTAKSRYWFLIDESLSKGDEQLISSVRTMPTEEMPTVDPNNNSVQFKGKMRYDIGHLDAHWIVGSAAV